MVNCCKRLSVRGLVLQVRSWSGNDVQINLHQTDCYSLFWQESARSPGTTFTLWGPGPDWEEAGLSWQLLRVTSTQLSLLRERGVQEAAGPQAPQIAHTEGAGPSDRPHYTQTAAVIRRPRWGWRRGSLPLQDLELASEQPWRGLWSPTGSSLVPGAPSSPTGTAEGAEEPWGESQDPTLTSLSAWGPPLHWLLVE